MDNPTNWLPWLMMASTAVSSVLLWGFASGRWLQKHEDHRNTLVDRLVSVERDVVDLERVIREGDSARHANVERVNTDLGRLEQRLAIIERAGEIATHYSVRDSTQLERRLDRLETQLREIQLDERRHGDRRQE